MKKIVHEIICPECDKEHVTTVMDGYKVLISEEPEPPNGYYLVESMACGGSWCDNRIYTYAPWDWTIMILEEL